MAEGGYAPLSTPMPSAWGMSIDYLMEIFGPGVEQASAYMQSQLSKLSQDSSSPSALLEAQAAMSEFENDFATMSGILSGMSTSLSSVNRNIH